MIGPYFTPEEKVKRCINRNPGWTDKHIADSTGQKQAFIRGVRAEGQPNPPAEANGNASLVSLDKVIARYDTKAAILKAIGELPPGKLIVEAELCQRAAGTDRNRFRRTCENNADEFNPLRIKLRLDDSADGKWFWGRASDIAEAQKIVKL